MATTFAGTNAVTTTSAANFIPEIWSDEIVAAYKKNLVMANMVKKMNCKGKKGDTVHIPSSHPWFRFCQNRRKRSDVDRRY